MEFKPPEHMSLQGNNAENWRKWSARFTQYLYAKEATDKDDKVKIGMLLTVIGPEAHDRYDQLQGLPGDRDPTYVEVVEAFRVHFEGEKRTVFLRYQFWTLERGEAEPYSAFISRLKILANQCEFTEKDNMIRDKIVFTVSEKPLKERLLRENNLTLKKAEDMSYSFEITQVEVRTMSVPAKVKTEKSVEAIGKYRFSHKQKKPQYQSQYQPPPQPQATPQSDRKSRYKCNRCATRHAKKQCPAYGQQCGKCGGLHHWAVCCKTKKTHAIEVEGAVGGNEVENYVHPTYITPSYTHTPGNKDPWMGSILMVDENSVRNQWYVPVAFGPQQQKIRMKVDSGAEANTIPMDCWVRLTGAPKLQRTNTTLKAFGDKRIPVKGRAMIQAQVGDKKATIDVYVAPEHTMPILGLETCETLGLIQPGENLLPYIEVNQLEKPQPLTEDSVKTTYADVFGGLGSFPDKYHIQLKEDAEPVIHPPRRVAPALTEPLKMKLQDMESNGVIRPVDGPTDWVNSLVITEKKNGSLRLCLDPKDLNKSIKREQFQIPTFEDVITRMGSKKVFTILDLKDSYWQVELDDESAKLTTFNTPFGRYCFTRMPFGINSASEILQKSAYKAFGDLRDVHIIADDMLIAGDDDEDHDEILRSVLERAKVKGTQFNPEKMQFKQPEVSYMGRLVGKAGIKPDPEKIAAIAKMPEPVDKAGVQRFIGVLNFLAPFIPNMSTLTTPLRNLLKSDVPWHWGPEHSQAVTKLKKILCSNPVLKLYDPKMPVIIQADASSTGLGTCLMQESRPVAYASRALTSPETRYAQIEREMLAIVFAAEQFHQYIYGHKEVTIQNDHKPLESIVQKPLHSASPRLQLMRLRLMRYRLEVRYVPGSKLHIADTLSRAHGKDEPSQEMDGELRVHSVSATLPASPGKIEEIQQATAQDEALVRLKKYTYEGWPSHKGCVPLAVQHYWPLRAEIHEDDKMMFVDDKLIVPTELRADMLQRLHMESHQGADKCKARARECLYWPRMAQEIEQYVASCATCATFKPASVREPMVPHPVPERAWSKLGADIFDFGGKDYLVVVDYYSKYPEVANLDSKSAEGVIKVLKPIFARHGAPDVLMSDNNPFNSHRMKEFAEDWGFELVTSSPRYPQSNGQSERYVGIMKSIMRKALEEGRDPNMALLEYRTTPLTGMKYSPAQLLMSRRLKTRIPMRQKLLEPRIAWSARAQLRKRKQVQKHYYDRGSRSKPTHKVGESVRVQFGKTWDRAIVTGIHSAATVILRYD